MNNVQKQFAGLVKAAIHKEKVNLNGRDSQWNKIIEEAKAHDIQGLIYSAIDKNDAEFIGQDIYEKLKKDTLFSAMYQKKHIGRISEIFKKFEIENIDIIALKGLVVRELYPRPDLRTMGDADILVKEKDLNKVKSILEEMGYRANGTIKNHTEFIHDLYSSVEVHWTLGKDKYIDIVKDEEQDMWNRAREIDFYGSKAFSLDIEDLCLYLFIHMKSHVKKGFGIRQLCDISLLIEKYRNNIDWTRFKNRVSDIDSSKFIGSVLSICNRLLDLEIPKELDSIVVKDKKIIDNLINHIFSGGVHGKRNISEKISNISTDIGYEGKNKSDSLIKKIFLGIFPPVESIKKTYVYLEKSLILLPIAYIQRIFEITFYDKYKIFRDFKTFKNEFNLLMKKNKLVKWLEL